MGCGKSAPIEPQPPEEVVSATASRNADKKAAQLENKEYHARMKFLSEVPLMKRLPKDEHPIVAEACEVCIFEPGHKIIQQGDNGDAFYVVRTGEASVHLENEDGKNLVATLKGGDYFGENALLRDEPRLATIIAESKLVALRITREKFEELGLNNKLMFANRKAVAGGLQMQAKAKPPTEKTEEDVVLITRALQENEYLATMTALDDARLKSFIDVMWKEEVKEGEQIITEGDLKADFFYIVASGEFDVKIAETDDEGNPKAVMESTVSKSVTHVTAGGSFGELALMYFVPRAATIVATTDSEVWVIDRANFKNILMKASDSRIKEYVKYLDQVSVLDSLLAEEKKQVANALVEMHFERKDVIIQQGEPGNMFYIMYEGEVEIVKDGEAVATLDARIKSGTAQFFGEKALLENENRTATVAVKSSSAKCLVLDRESFDLLLGPLKDIIDAVREGRERPHHTAANPAENGSLAQNRQRIRRSELKRIGLLGCGGFGAVELWEHTKTGDSYALKAISKGYIVKTGMQESIMNEKNILAMTNSSFITKLYETFNGTQTLYFLLEPCLGGELYATYIRKGLYGSDKHCKFYTGSVVFAFEHMHQRRIIYRDLKPENLLLAEDGFMKLTDMGLAKFVVGKTYTTCGTPDYFAPELIASTGHTNAVDWWTLGILIFELMSGHPPFESAYPMQIYAKVTKGIGKVAFPSVMKGHCKNLVENLLKNDPSDRLAMRKGGVANVKSHPWFEDMDWDRLERMECQVPYKPAVRSRKDLSNFVAKKEDAPKTLELLGRFFRRVNVLKKGVLEWGRDFVLRMACEACESRGMTEQPQRPSPKHPFAFLWTSMLQSWPGKTRADQVDVLEVMCYFWKRQRIICPDAEQKENFQLVATARGGAYSLDGPPGQIRKSRWKATTRSGCTWGRRLKNLHPEERAYITQTSGARMSYGEWMRYRPGRALPCLALCPLHLVGSGLAEANESGLGHRGSWPGTGPVPA
ncbi:for [Symbiodinium sp. CCMP2456]|nr:for [Symbiodinium sp. CCMP2456]